MKKEDIPIAIKELKERLIKRFGEGVQLFLFGSVARGDFEEDSDIDILVLLPFDINNSLEEEIFGIAYGVELEYDVIFGIIVFSRDFWNSGKAGVMPLHKNITKEGISL